MELQGLLESSRQQIMQDSISRVFQRLIAHTEQLERLEDLMFVFSAGPESQVATTLSKLKGLRIEQLRQSTPAILNETRASTTSTNQLTVNDPLRLFKYQFSQNETDGIHLAKYNDELVVIDWKYINPDQVQQTVGVTGTRFLGMIKDLAKLLDVSKPEEFCTLPLRGYLDDSPSRYGYLFKIPSHIDRTFKCESLHDLMHREDYVPSLTDRINLAKKLAGALSLFHAAGWLHKGLTNKHILFFTPSGPLSKKEATTVNLMERPYIIGFNYARLENEPYKSEKPPENPREDIYRHPNAQYPASESIKFKPIYDVYSLGVVFMELACWRRMSSILKSHTRREVNDFSREDLMKIKSWLIEISESYNLSFNVGFRAGSEFSKVVRRCLAGELEGGEREYCDGLQDAFFEEVISCLHKCYI